MGQGTSMSMDETTCSSDAENGHLKLLKWARVNGCPWDEDTYDAGRVNGDPALMLYLEDQGCPHPWYEEENLHY